MKWREENKIDSILDCMPDPYFTKNYPYWMNGVDKKGQPGVLLITYFDNDTFCT